MALLNLSLCVVQGLLNDAPMPGNALIEARCIHMHHRPANLHAPLRHLFGALIDKTKKQMCLGMICQNCCGYLPQNRRFPGLGRSNN
jgi:hypothetical protein